MDLSTTYLGLELSHPLMPGASPMVDDLGLVQRLAEAGAAAIVMHSLFEEQIEGERGSVRRHHDVFTESHAEARSYFPDPPAFALGPDEYLEQIGRIRRLVDVPVIASLNGTTPGGWLRYARLMQAAGAAAVELNVYELATDVRTPAGALEQRVVQMLAEVKREVTIPVAVKLSPFHTALAAFARELEDTGADGLVLFNRFYQPDIDIEALEVVRSLRLSDSSELLLRLRWLAVLSARLQLSLAASGGVHERDDIIKALMTGAHAVQLVSALLRYGPERLPVLRAGLAQWLEQHEYHSLRQMQGSMDLRRCPDAHAYERANYMHVLHSFADGLHGD